jgi:hypothetical protein
MGSFPHAPSSLVVFGITCAILAALLILLLVWHAVRRILDVPRVPRGAGFYVLMVVVAAAALGAGVGALVVAAALDDWPGVIGQPAQAELRCRRQSPTAARLSFVPLDPRGPEEAEVVPACEVAVDRLRFGGRLNRFGLFERFRLAQVGTRARPPGTPEWRALPQPFGVPVAGISQQRLAVPPDDQPYRLVADDRGIRLDKVAR